MYELTDLRMKNRYSYYLTCSYSLLTPPYVGHTNHVGLNAKCLLLWLAGPSLGMALCQGPRAPKVARALKGPRAPAADCLFVTLH